MHKTRENQHKLEVSKADDAPHRIGDPKALNEGLGLSSELRLSNRIFEIQRLLWLPKGLSDEETHLRLARAIEFYEGLAPSDTGEAMLAQQMVGTHEAAMECLRRAMLPYQTFEGRSVSLKQAAQLMALYEKQLRTLQKSKGKGQQKVTVEHVHVAPGGQAIVGHVEAGTPTAASMEASPAPHPSDLGARSQDDVAPSKSGHSSDPTIGMAAQVRPDVQRRHS